MRATPDHRSGGRAAGAGAGAAAVAAAVLATAGLAAGAIAGWDGVDVAWAPSLGLRLAFDLDGLALLYGLLAAGIGVAVFAYASAYIPRHLDHGGRPRAEAARFHGLMALFLVAMLGLALAQDLILLFVFWDLTAVTSYLLIAFDRERREARVAALMALLVTAGSALLLLVAVLMLRAEYGTTSIPEVLAAVEGGRTATVAGVLIAVAALAKSAQVPLHFWLPRAMQAPTPVSAYLHSAAMVAAGVFLLSRLHPVLATSGAVLDGLLVVGLLSMAVGGVLALGARELKQVLAHSTIAQYGYVVAMLGVGTPAALAAACFYVVAHALAKSALFLTAGAVTEATGADRLEDLGGLARRMPLLAAGSAAAAAGLSSLPLTLGFFKDELFFAAAAERGTWLGVLAVAGAALTFAYVWRFWGSIFLGRAVPAAPRAIPALLVAPVAALGALVLAGGLVPSPVSALAEAAGEVVAASPVSAEAAYYLDARAENVMALLTYAAGLALLLGRAAVEPLAAGAARLGRRHGPAAMYEGGLRRLNALSDRIHTAEVQDIRGRVAFVFVPGGLLVALAILATPSPTLDTFRVGSLGGDDVLLVLALIVAAMTAVAATRPRRHVALVLSLSAVGFSLTVVYALFGGADVALVSVLVETVLALLFLRVLALVPTDVLRREAELQPDRNRRWRDPLIGVVAGLGAFLVTWSALSRPGPEEGVAANQLELAESAHGKDVVTVILADFRGLDTLVEITVVLVALVGTAQLLRKGRVW